MKKLFALPLLVAVGACSTGETVRNTVSKGDETIAIIKSYETIKHVNVTVKDKAYRVYPNNSKNAVAVAPSKVDAVGGQIVTTLMFGGLYKPRPAVSTYESVVLTYLQKQGRTGCKITGNTYLDSLQSQTRNMAQLRFADDIQYEFTYSCAR